MHRPAEVPRLAVAPAVPRAAPPSHGTAEQASAWRVLVADHDPEVHSVAQASLQGLVLLERPVALLHAHSFEQARLLLRQDDLALVLLGLDGAADPSGLELVRCMRHDAGLRNTRVILRAEHASLDLLQHYDIDDYRAKAELSPARLQACVAAALRCYEQVRTIESNRRSLERIVRSNAVLLEQTDLHAF
ncbi:MAG TPA: DUF3369 domain-containing protein, partial [Burkholderiaceae bacterium]